MGGPVQFGWTGLLIKAVVLLGSVASLAGLVVQFAASPDVPLPDWVTHCRAILVVSGVALLGGLFVLEARQYKSYRKFRAGNKKAINRYMYRWIKRGGRVAIWTRDMSWAKDRKVRDLLERKADDDELVICIHKTTDLTDDLKSKGASVYVYGDHLAHPALSRFTITQYDSEGSRVAVGRAVGNHHVIEEFTAGQHPAHSIARDLVHLTEQLPNRAP